MPAAALAVLVAPHLTGSHSTDSTHAAAPYIPVAATRALPSTDVAAPHAATAKETVLQQRFYAGVLKAKHDAALKRFYAGIQAQRDAQAQAQRAATLQRFYAGLQQAAAAKPAVVAAPAAAPSGPAANMNWSALAACESSGNPQAVSSGGYMGLYQFDQRTWESVGGTGSPLNASSAEQTLRAEILFSQRGSSPWPVCGSRLYS
jgi:membrane-bound lytic murein transglycosylase MltF